MVRRSISTFQSCSYRALGPNNLEPILLDARHLNVFTGWYRSLHFKIASGVILTILVLGAFDFGVDYLLYRRQLVNDQRTYAANLSRITLRGILELAMLGRHPELLQAAIERLVEEQVEKNPPIKEVMLLDLDGKVRFSSQIDRIGTVFRREQMGCRECHVPPRESTPDSSFIRLREEEILRSVTPVPNRPECRSCHGDINAYNGVLVMDFSIAAQWAEMHALFSQMLLKTSLTVVAILGVLGLLLNKLVITRIGKLKSATDQVARHSETVDLSELTGGDEISQLSDSFTRMSSNVTASIQKLRSQKRYLQDLVDGLQDSLVVVGPDLRIEMANLRAAEVWRSELSPGRVLGDTLLVSGVETILRTLREGRMEMSEVRVFLSDNPTYFEVFSSPIWDQSQKVDRAIVVFRDVTERKTLERQMSRAERLASLGQLAAGMAHEVNNPMAAITTCAEGLERYLESSVKMNGETRGEVHDYLQTIGEAASRCKEITEQLLGLSSDHGDLRLEEIDLCDVVGQIRRLVGHTAQQKSIELATEITRGMLIMGDRQKLSQLILNLTLNGIEAIRSSGRVVIQTVRVDDLVELSVEDNGCGIPDEHLDRLFDPFFTTKKEGRGTGLGLSICEHIVRQHQGRISITSSPAKGTRVSVLFPGLESQ